MRQERKATAPLREAVNQLALAVADLRLPDFFDANDAVRVCEGVICWMRFTVCEVYFC